MYKIAEDEMVICPYNRYHVVRKLRIQKHIIKCQKNYPDVKLSTCFYNYCHRLDPQNMLSHYEVCSHKTRVEGSRYEFDYTKTASENDDIRTGKFPDIHVKPQFFCEHFKSLRSSAQLSCENSDKLDSSSDSSDSMSTYKIEFSDNNGDSDDDLEPLPLPKTVSKAFTCAKQKPNELMYADSPKISLPIGFGRAKSFLACLPSRPSSTTQQSLPESSTAEKEINSSIFPNYLHDSSSASAMSSMFDETSTLKSEEVLYDRDDSDEDNTSESFFKNFDKYMKL